MTDIIERAAREYCVHIGVSPDSLHRNREESNLDYAIRRIREHDLMNYCLQKAKI